MRQRGFGTLVRILLKVGHGHPTTFLKHYFALWDLLIAVFSQASMAKLPASVDALAKSHGSAAAAALRQAQRRGKGKGLDFDPVVWMTSYLPEGARVPQFESEPVVRASIVREPSRAENASAPIENQAMYVALRITQQDEIAAAHQAKLPTSVAARLERLFNAGACFSIRSRHQAKDSATARKSEVSYLIKDRGWVLASHLATSPAETVNALGEALAPMRAGSYVLPPVEVLQAWLIRFASCLPPELALLVQLKKGRLQSPDVARLESKELRIHVAPADRDLGDRPRLFVVPSSDPFNFVERPRRTSNVRALIAALNLIRNNPWSEKQ